MSNRQKGFTLIELLIVVGIILVVAAIAIPNLLRARVASEEASVVGSLRRVNDACVKYFTTYGYFPAALANLGPASTPSSSAADLIDDVLAGGVKDGYTFTYAPGAPNSLGTVQSYTIHANPIALDKPGRFFYTDESRVIRWAVGNPAGANDEPLP